MDSLEALITKYMTTAPHTWAHNGQKIPAELMRQQLSEFADELAALSRPVEGVKGDPVAYVARYGGRCRDCADHDGICPTSGLPCNVEDCNKAISHVIKALTYGIAHGYIDALSAPPVAESEALRERVADGRWENQARQATSVIAMIRAMIGEMFGPVIEGEVFGPVIESEEATLLRGPEAKHSGEAILEALQKIEARLAQAERGPAVTEAMVSAARKTVLHTNVFISEEHMRAALEAALHPQLAAGEEGK